VFTFSCQQQEKQILSCGLNWGFKQFKIAEVVVAVHVQCYACITAGESRRKKSYLSLGAAA